MAMASKKVMPSVPGKEAKAKTSKPLKPAKAFRSAEFIEDSDEEATKVVRKKQTPKAEPPSKRSTKPKVDTSITKPSKKRKSVSLSPEKDESTQNDTEEERSSHSGDGSDSEESSSAQEGSPTPAGPKETASRPATNSAAVEDSAGKTQLNKPKAPGKSSVRRTPSPRTASPSESEEDSESSTGGDESGSESESSDQTSRKSPRKENPIQKPVTCTQENIIFKPPPGFEPASIFVHPSSQAMNMFSHTNLAGKEIWHITAPSSVPISSIKELSQQSILSKSSILSYEGSDYGLISDSSTDEALMLPSAEDNDYKSHNAATIQNFHLQQIVSLPYHAFSPAKSSNQSAPTLQAYKRATREQPEGLRMRYHPFGVVDIADDDLLSMDVPKVPQFRVPGAGDATPAEKRKRSSMDHGAQSSIVSISKVRSKKAKVRQEATVNEHHDVMDVDTIDQPASRKQDASKAKANGVSENHDPKSAKSKTKPKATKNRPEHPPHQSAASQSLLPADIAEQAEIIMPEEVVTNGASAIEITASEEKKTKRKRRKETAKAAEKENVAKADMDIEMRDAETPSRESKGQSATPGKSSVQKQATATNGEMDEDQATPKETKEEKRKRKEEKRKRKKEAGKV